MRSTQHALIGAAAGLGLGVAGAATGLPVLPDPIGGALLAALGGVLPDTDSPGGWLRALGPRGVRLAEAIRVATYPPARRGGTGHRGLLHSGMAALLVFAVPALVWGALVAPLGPAAVARVVGACLALELGYVLHLLADARDDRGIPLGAPFTWRRWYGGRRRAKNAGGAISAYRARRPASRSGALRTGADHPRVKSTTSPLGGGATRRTNTLPPDWTDAAWRRVEREPLPAPRG